MEDYLPSQPITDSHIMTKPQTPAQNLLQLVKQLIKEEQYNGVALLFTSELESARNLNCVKEIGMDLLHDVCLKHLNDSNHAKNYSLYGCAEQLLKVIATHAPAEELLLELLELVEEQKSEYVFTSTLRALQEVLLRLGDHKPRALEWSLNSIQIHLAELPVPEYLQEGYDLKQQRLLEQDDLVQNLLMHYITVGLFYEPLLKDIISKRAPKQEIFRTRDMNRRNVLCCFLMQLLGEPLSLLDLTIDDRNSNTYTVQCARSLTEGITQCISDPFYFLCLAESRVRWKRGVDSSKDVFEVTSKSNIFLIPEKLPLDSLVIYIYMVLVEGVDAEAVPKIYAPLYIFETGLFLATELLNHVAPPLHYRGILLGKRILKQLNNTAVPAVSLELEVHKNFCLALCNIVGYSSLKHLRQEGVDLLRKYILQFDDEGKYLVLKNLLASVGHTAITGYLATVYKDIVSKALFKSSAPLPASFSGKHFRSIFLNNICQLPQGAETDLVDHSDKVIYTLNSLRFFALSDCSNRTGFWDFVTDIEHQYLEPLRNGINLSMAHYRAELECVEKGLDAPDEAAEREQLQLLDISFANAKSEDNAMDFKVDRQHKIKILNKNLCTFELMRSVLARLTECLESSAKLYKPKQSL